MAPSKSILQLILSIVHANVECASLLIAEIGHQLEIESFEHPIRVTNITELRIGFLHCYRSPSIKPNQFTINCAVLSLICSHIINNTISILLNASKFSAPPLNNNSSVPISIALIVCNCPRW